MILKDRADKNETKKSILQLRIFSAQVKECALISLNIYFKMDNMTFPGVTLGQSLHFTSVSSALRFWTKIKS